MLGEEQNSTFNHTRSGDNIQAHNLTHLALYEPNSLWMEEIPNCKNLYNEGRSPSYEKGSQGYPKKNTILEVVGMYLYPAILNNKH